jgi:hypothetical protein
VATCHPLGDTIYIHIPDYIVIEKFPPSSDPFKIYRDLEDETRK